MKILWSVSSLISMAFVLAGCPGNNSDHVRTRYQIMGDPMQMIVGATLEPAVDFSFFDNTNEVYIFNIVEFSEKKSVHAILNKLHASFRDPEKQNAAAKEQDSGQAYRMTVKRTNGRLRLINTSLNLNIEFQPSEIAGQYKMVLFAKGYESEESRVLHFSRSKGGEYSSFLVHDKDDKEGDGLTAIYFAREWRRTRPPQTKSPFYYLHGPGAKVRWSGPNLRLDICGARASQYELKIRDAIQKWNVALESRFKIESQALQQYPPFSDLKNHCMYFVDSYFTEPDMKYGNYGLTSPIIETNMPSIVGGDVFIMTKEFEKGGLNFGSPYLESEFKYTLVHEIGHFLGLDHQFDGTKSVMSYKFESDHLTAYDMAAIWALYE